MKRLFKFLVAAATSLSLLIANVPLTSIVVRADGNPPVFKNGENGSIQLDLKDSSYVHEGSDVSFFTLGNVDHGHTFSATTISVTYTENLGLDKLVIRDQERTVAEFTSGNTTGTYTVDSDFRIVDLYTYDEPVEGGAEGATVKLGVLDITRVIKVDIYSNLTRNLFIEKDGNGEQVQVRGTPDSAAVHEELWLGGMPDTLVIENPGGMGVEEMGRLTGVTINGVDRDITARYDYCEYSLEGLTGYSIEIVITGDNTPGGVIEWTNYGCPEGKRQHNISEAEQFKYGSAKVVGVYAADDKNFENNIMSQYGIGEEGCIYDEYGNGCLRIENGYWIAFEFIPLPGYQLVTFGGSAGGQDVKIGTTDRPNVYYFQMPEGNCHFGADFDTPENIVKINGNSIVDDGSVAVAQNEFAGGTAQMTVGALGANDQSAYNQDKDFTAELKDGNLEVQEYLSLDLANIYQKANTEDYWEEEYHNLEKGKATVSLKVDDEFNPDNSKVYIVHDKGGDAGFETIEADYNPNTHEITFETGSFSNFMITTSNEKNDIEVDPNYNPENNEEEPENEPPHFSVALTDDDEPALGNWEGEDNPFFVALRVGTAIPGDAVINNDLPKDLPEECKLIYFINGEEVESFSVTERKSFSPGHFVTYEGIKVTETTCEVYFNECWVVGIEVDYLDLSMKALDKDGKEIKPLDEGDLIFECGDADEEDFTYYEIAFAEQPSEIAIKGINDYAIFYIMSGEDDYLDTPIGENKIPYPEKEDYMFIYAWGSIPKTETADFTESLKTVSAVFEGVSEDKANDYILVVSEFDTADAPAEDIAAAKKQLEEMGYTGVTFPLGFDINLFDKNGAVHEPGFTVRITLVLNEALDLKDGETVVIVHATDDGFELLTAIYNATNLTLTFETKTFSPFVVTIGTYAPASIVKTGETVSQTRIVVATLLITAAAAAGILFIKRRRDEAEEEE